MVIATNFLLMKITVYKFRNVEKLEIYIYLQYLILTNNMVSFLTTT